MTIFRRHLRRLALPLVGALLAAAPALAQPDALPPGAGAAKVVLASEAGTYASARRTDLAALGRRGIVLEEKGTHEAAVILGGLCVLHRAEHRGREEFLLSGYRPDSGQYYVFALDSRRSPLGYTGGTRDGEGVRQLVTLDGSTVRRIEPRPGGGWTMRILVGSERDQLVLTELTRQPEAPVDPVAALRVRPPVPAKVESPAERSDPAESFSEQHLFLQRFAGDFATEDEKQWLFARVVNRGRFLLTVQARDPGAERIETLTVTGFDPNRGVYQHLLLPAATGIPQYFEGQREEERLLFRDPADDGRSFTMHALPEGKFSFTMALASGPVRRLFLPQRSGPSEADRAEWIATRVKRVEEGAAKERQAALKELLDGDREGDCVRPLLDLLKASKKDEALMVALIRGLGRDGLHLAAPEIARFLRHRAPAVRGNAAVSLEHIGCPDKAVLSALQKMAGRERDEALANHAYRALGRCGAGNSRVRSYLLKQAASARSEFASFGPIIGLAYFEKEARAARGVEQILERLAIPGGGWRASRQNTVKRSLLSWTLAWIADPRSAPFVRERLIERLRNRQEPWVQPLIGFWEEVAAVCEGQGGSMETIEGGVRVSARFLGGGRRGRGGNAGRPRSMMDAYRKDRPDSGFTPRGDGIMGSGR